jgi:pilus assembly protein Flp/PilA
MHTQILKLAIRMQTLMGCEEGQDLIEYALVLGLVALGATAAIKAMGGGLDFAFTVISNTLASSLT